MMPDFTSSDPGTLGRAWRERCRPQIWPALAMGVLIGFLVGGGLTLRQVPPDSLLLWCKYRIAQAAEVTGLSSVAITWPGERGETDTTVGELLRTPGLHAWADPVSREIGAALLPAAVCSLLAFAVMLIWGGGKPAPAGRAVERALPEPPAEPTLPAAPTVEAGPVAQSEPPRPPAEAPLPVTLPHLAPFPADPTPAPVEMPLPVTLPHLTAPAPLPTQTLVATQPEQPFAPSLSQTYAAPAGKKMLSYETHWGLTQLPFENVPDPKFYFPAPMHEEALHRLLYGIQTRKGAVMLTGEIGCGKTLLSRELGLHLNSRQYDLALIANPSFGVEDFLGEILYQLEIEPTTTKVKLLHRLNERLLANYKNGRQTIIIVDEAQAILDNQVFEELRLLLNFQLNDRFLLTLVLMGQPELNDRVAALKQFAQRISIKFHLGAFSREETSQYVVFRLKAAHCQREVFSQDALAVIFERSAGIPRSINRLCDLCLLIGYMDRAAMVDQKIAERAAADLA
jgi:general secretion pathway protein A